MTAALAGELELVWRVSGRVAESPVWDPRRRSVFFLEMTTGVVFEYGVDGRRHREWALPAPVAALGLCRSGRLLVAMERDVAVLDPDSGELTRLSGEIDEPTGNRFNDGKVGPDGAFWVGTRDARRGSGDGRVPDGNGGLWRIAPDGSMDRRAHGYATSNGLAWSPDGRVMYSSDSHNGFVDAWDFDPATGAISGRRRFAQLGDADGRPDGAACDADGNYWSAGVSAGCLNVFRPDGSLLAKLEVPLPAPSMLCFGDGEIFVTSIARDESRTAPHHRSRVPGLSRATTEVRGAEVAMFADDPSP